jgi:hypothetical protein
LPPLDDISKEELYNALYNENIGLRETNIELKEKLAGLQFQVAQFNRLVFGQTRERFVPTQSPKQATLFTSHLSHLSHLAPQKDTFEQIQLCVITA